MGLITTCVTVSNLGYPFSVKLIATIVWSNFEIADMSFWRSQAYEDYFNHLDRAGGFFYERWGDAPVHSIALGLFEDASKIHWYVFPLLIHRCPRESGC